MDQLNYARNKYTYIHTPTHTCTPAYTHKHTRTREMYESKPLPPQASRIATRPLNTPSPRKPFAYQLAVQTSTRIPLINKPAYSHECYPLLTEVPSTLLFLSLSCTNLRFSLASMHRRAHPCSLSHPFTN
jgi:hypothetical protein